MWQYNVAYYCCCCSKNNVEVVRPPPLFCTIYKCNRKVLSLSFLFVIIQV